MRPMPADSAEPAAAMAEYYARLERAHLAPLWESLAALAPPEPRALSRPFKWAFGEVRAHLLEAGERISAEKAERRVVVLANPALPGKLQANDTLYAGLQLILPGEIAPPHRHTQAALRFVLEGQGAYTAVDGERVVMHPGDFIITPAWSWHEHGGGEEPVIWLDGLDVGLVAFLHSEFREEPRGQPMAASGDAPSRFNWPYGEARTELERMRAAGEVDPWRGVRLDYRHADGRPAMATLGASLTLLPKDFANRPYKSTDGALAVLVEGRVEAEAGGETFALGPGDALALPGWTPHRFHALEESVLFAFCDQPTHQALGLWREWRGEAG
jgi:gentisate 1,2-dioxygenase